MASGNALLAALASISDASAAKRYLLKLEPGIYRVDPGLVMKPFVDIEGSGELSTRLISDPSLPTATVMGAPSTDLRYLSIEQRGSSAGDAVAYSGSGPGAIFLDHVFLYAEGDPTSTAVSLPGSVTSAQLEHVVATAGAIDGTDTVQALSVVGAVASIRYSEFGAFDGDVETRGINNQGNLRIFSSNVSGGASVGTAAGIRNAALLSVWSSSITCCNSVPGSGIQSVGGQVMVEHSTLAGNTSSISSTSTTTKVASSKLVNAAAGTGYTCVFVYDVDFDATTCPG